MTDRELLELAAKAAGYAVSFDSVNSIAGRWKPSAKVDRIFWNPLSNDGDALRLAVMLGLDVGHGVNPAGYNVIMVSHAEKFVGWFEEPHDTDPCAATRRCICRAAAEIGKAMP